MSKNNQITIRNLDPEVYKRARMYAIKPGVLVSEVINRAIEDYLKERPQETHGSLIPQHLPRCEEGVEK